MVLILAHGQGRLSGYEPLVLQGPSVVYAVAVNCLYKDRVSRVRVRVRDTYRVSGRVTDRVRFRV